MNPLRPSFRFCPHDNHFLLRLTESQQQTSPAEAEIMAACPPSRPPARPPALLPSCPPSLALLLVWRNLTCHRCKHLKNKRNKGEWNTDSWPLKKAPPTAGTKEARGHFNLFAPCFSSHVHLLLSQPVKTREWRGSIAPWWPTAVQTLAPPPLLFSCLFA